MIDSDGWSERCAVAHIDEPTFFSPVPDQRECMTWQSTAGQHDGTSDRDARLIGVVAAVRFVSRLGRRCR